jgi:TetR/AcrR family transcriptional regulator, transcriptional repressor for nem operon
LKLDTNRYLCCMRDPKGTKEAILRKSGILFNTQGYKATSLSEITDSTGFTKGAIYKHFKNKDVLELESLNYLATVMFQKMREKVREQKNAGDKLRSLFTFFESYVSNPPVKGGCPLLNVAIEADDTSPTLRKGANQFLSLFRDSIITILDNGVRYDQIKSNVDKEFYATLIIASLEGAIMMSKLSGNNSDIKKVTKHLKEQIEQIEI